MAEKEINLEKQLSRRSNKNHENVQNREYNTTHQDQINVPISNSNGRDEEMSKLIWENKRLKEEIATLKGENVITIMEVCTNQKTKKDQTKHDTVERLKILLSTIETQFDVKDVTEWQEIFNKGRGSNQLVTQQRTQFSAIEKLSFLAVYSSKLLNWHQLNPTSMRGATDTILKQTQELMGCSERPVGASSLRKWIVEWKVILERCKNTNYKNIKKHRTNPNFDRYAADLKNIIQVMTPDGSSLTSKHALKLLRDKCQLRGVTPPSRGIRRRLIKVCGLAPEKAVDDDKINHDDLPAWKHEVQYYDKTHEESMNEAMRNDVVIIHVDET